MSSSSPQLETNDSQISRLRQTQEDAASAQQALDIRKTFSNQKDAIRDPDAEDSFESGVIDCSMLSLSVTHDGMRDNDEGDLLFHNVTVSDILPTRAYHFYQVCVAAHNSHQVVRVELHSVKGDADL